MLTHCADVDNSNVTRIAHLCIFFSLEESLLDKLQKVCVAGVQSLVQHCECEVTEGGFLHSAAVWVLNQVLTSFQDIKR